MSRHVPTPSQMRALEQLFPQFELVVDARAFDGADDICARFRASGAQEMVVVAPLTVVRAIVKRGLKPLYAEMQQVACDSPEVEVRVKRNICYKFIQFHRCTGVKLELEPVHPNAPPND